MPIAEITGNSLILLGVLIALVIIIPLSLFTVRGSGINLHRYRSKSAPGSDGPAEKTGVDQGEGSATEESDGTQ